MLSPRPMRRRPLLVLALAAAFSLAGASCLSPTLPVPPPEIDSITQTADGLWTIGGSCEKGAIVTVFNETQAQGVVVEDKDLTGHFVVKLSANHCDTGWTSAQMGNTVSTASTFVVEAKSPNDMSAPSTCVAP